MVLGSVDGAGFVGREAEQGVLAARLQVALAGKGQVVLLAGEPGIGKSRLASEIAKAAAVSGVEFSSFCGGCSSAAHRGPIGSAPSP